MKRPQQQPRRLQRAPAEAAAAAAAAHQPRPKQQQQLLQQAAGSLCSRPALLAAAGLRSPCCGAVVVRLCCLLWLAGRNARVAGSGGGSMWCVTAAACVAARMCSRVCRTAHFVPRVVTLGACEPGWVGRPAARLAAGWLARWPGLQRSCWCAVAGWRACQLIRSALLPAALICRSSRGFGEPLLLLATLSIVSV